MSIKFGLWSTVLLVGSAHGLIVACLLWRAHANRLANRALAGLLLAVVLMITPYTLGYAGAYDAWPWLTFAPFFWQLGFGPLLWIYVRQLGEPSMPRRWFLHFLPVAIQGGYYIVLFVHPTAWKWAWSDTIQDPYVMPLQNGLLGLSLMTYWGAALTRYRRWQQWLEANSGAREEFRLRWLRTFLYMIGLTIVIGAGFRLYDQLVRPLTYFDLFPLYLVFTLLVYALGMEGWRNAARAYPAMAAPGPVDISVAVPAPAVGVGHDWTRQGQLWSDSVATAGWFREPDITLADVARRLGTNTAYLSRAFNEGLGIRFGALINQLRVKAACDALDGSTSVLDVALAVGFGSKATFNRVFLAETGLTPTAWRSRRLEGLKS